MPAEIFRPRHHHVDPDKVHDYVMQAAYDARAALNELGLDTNLIDLVQHTSKADRAREEATSHNVIHRSLSHHLLFPKMAERAYGLLNETRHNLPQPFQGEEHVRE